MDWKPLREKIAKQGMRNSNVLAIAPTATISNIMGTTPCIEPTYKNLFVKSNSGVLGPLPEVNDVVVSVDGTHVHSHDKMDACKFAPSFHTVVTALPLSALRPP